MTRTLSLRSLDIPSIHKFGIGFDSMMNELMRMNESQPQTNYPPYNVVKITEDDFNIEIACAGFVEGEITAKLDNRILSVVGKRIPVEDSKAEYLHKGISDRDFAREFTLAEHVQIHGADMTNGILTIKLKRVVPEDRAPKTIHINYAK